LAGRTAGDIPWSGCSLPACVDYKGSGENTIVLDCDVLHPTAAQNPDRVRDRRLRRACRGCRRLKNASGPRAPALLTSDVAVSVGIVDGEPRLDLCY